MSTGRGLTRGPSPNALVSSATGRDHSSPHRHQWPTAASRLDQRSAGRPACGCFARLAENRRALRLYRAYLLAQQLGQIYRVGFDHAIALLDAWLKWARRCRLEPFVKLARTITEQRPGIEAALRHGLLNECLSYCTSW